MPRSLIQLRQEAERTRIEAFEATLRRVPRRPRPAPDFERALAEAISNFEQDAVRPASAWQPQMKTRDPARLRLAAARHLFARYPVAEHLEQVWIDPAGLDPPELARRKSWYIAAAGGHSLYQAGAGALLTRKEVHAFTNPPGRLGFEQAFWHAIARSYVSEPSIALVIARSRIGRLPLEAVATWRQVVRFFAADPVPPEDIDDLSDYLADCFARDPATSLKGRTLASLRRQMEAWHRDLQAVARIEAEQRRHDRAAAAARGGRAADAGSLGRWAAAPIADWSWSPNATSRTKRIEYVVVQLVSAQDLVSETRTMSHCVSSYASKCIRGEASIWSMRRRMGAVTQRLLTIELDARHRVVQARGYANRRPYADEQSILERWSRARGATLVAG